MKKNKLLVLTSILFLSLSACGTKQEADVEMVESVETDNVLQQPVQEELEAAEEPTVIEQEDAEEPETEKVFNPDGIPGLQTGFDRWGYLTVLPEEGKDGNLTEYVARLYDKEGQLQQQFSCGKYEEEPEFFYDELTNDTYKDMEIFWTDRETKEQKGLLFIWDWENDCFIEEPIAIPKYDEIIESAWAFQVSKEEEDVQQKKLYRVNKRTKSVIELRQWTLQREAGMLTIWDCLEKKTLFKGNVKFDEDGNLIAEEYYRTLFELDSPWVWNYQEDSVINTWIEENGEYDTKEYADRDAFLSDFDVKDQKSFYEYYDRLGNLQLELYLDETSGKGCGVRYEWLFADDLQKVVRMYGFAFDTMQNDKWVEPDTFSLKSVEGTDGADEVTDYEEFVKYTEDGRVDSYYSQGVIDWLGNTDEGELSTILYINFVYREDGTLYYKSYGHNSYIFCTTDCSMQSYYDEKERLQYVSSYITHGSYETYYIYLNDVNKPSYCLGLDDNLGVYIPEMTCYQ